MIIKKDRRDKKESKYECDRCKAKLDAENRYLVYIKPGIKNTRKKWDLCYRCYRALERGIENNKQGENK